MSVSGLPHETPDLQPPHDVQPIESSLDGFVVPPPRPKFQDRQWLHLLLFLLTIGSTTIVGAGHYLAFLSDFVDPPSIPARTMLLKGFWYSGTILVILGAHELGHYFACRYYQVDASLPFFLPAPFVALTGTLGAFIKIREPIPSKRMLFDIGIAGPIAGFMFALPALFVGVAMSNVATLPPNFTGWSLGEPLLFKLVSWLLWGSIPEGSSLNLHPVAFAAWFGLLATALNLFPIGQLDGGHISYAVLGRRSTAVTLAMIAVAVCMTLFVSWFWSVWTVLLLVMMFTFGPRHPRTMDEQEPLDRTRRWLAVFALVMFALCFTYNPISPMELVGGR
jgi:membrane-associated protease RseP (regulator of RpoE activity)